MKIEVTDTGSIDMMYDKLDLILHLLAMGFTIGIVLAVVFAGIRLGWKLMPWVLAAGIIAYLIV